MTSKAKKHIIAVDITMLSPMHITAIEKGSYDVDRQSILRFKAPGSSAIGCSLTRTMALANLSNVKKSKDGEGAQESSNGNTTPLVPVIPSSTIGGKLRRAALDLIGNSLIDRSLKISPAAYNVMSSGMATTELKGADKVAEVMIMARKDAFISIFGGTSFALDSHCVIGAGLPLLDITGDLLMTPAIAEKQTFTSLKEMTEAIAIIKKDDVQDMRRENLSELVGFESISAYIESKNLETAESKKNKSKEGKDKVVEEDASSDSAATVDAREDKKKDIRTFNAFEAVKTGLNFGLRIELTSFDPAQLGLMLMAVQSFLRDAQVGGKGAKGFGRFTVAASRLYDVNPVTRTKNAGVQLFLDQNTGYEFTKSDSENDPVAEALLAAEDYLDNISPKLIEAFANADVPALKEACKKPEEFFKQ